MQKVRAIQRYLVTSILDSDYLGANGRRQPEKVRNSPNPAYSY
jgi:hypothetical protein